MKLWEKRAGTVSEVSPGSSMEKRSKPRNLGGERSELAGA